MWISLDVCYGILSQKKKLKIVSGHNQELVRNLTTDSEQNLNLSTPG